MPQANPLVTTVGAASVTYNPTGIDSNQVASFRDPSAPMLAMRPVVALSVEEPKAGGRKTTKGMMKLTIPREAAAGSPGAVTIELDLFKVEMVTGGTATQAQRELVLDKAIALLKHVDVRAAFVSPEHFW